MQAQPYIVVKPSQLPAASTINPTDLFILNQGTTTKKVTYSILNTVLKDTFLTKKVTLDSIAALRGDIGTGSGVVSGSFLKASAGSLIPYGMLDEYPNGSFHYSPTFLQGLVIDTAFIAYSVAGNAINGITQYGTNQLHSQYGIGATITSAQGSTILKLQGVAGDSITFSRSIGMYMAKSNILRVGLNVNATGTDVPFFFKSHNKITGHLFELGVQDRVKIYADSIGNVVANTDTLATRDLARKETFIIALSGEKTNLTVDTLVGHIYAPYPFQIVDIFVSTTEAPTGATVIYDIKKNFTSIFSTKISIDASEKTSLTAATAYVLTGTTTFAKGDYLSIRCDQIGSTLTGKGGQIVINVKRLGL